MADIQPRRQFLVDAQECRAKTSEKRCCILSLSNVMRVNAFTVCRDRYPGLISSSRQSVTESLSANLSFRCDRSCPCECSVGAMRKMLLVVFPSRLSEREKKAIEEGNPALQCHLLRSTSSWRSSLRSRLLLASPNVLVVLFTGSYPCPCIHLTKHQTIH